MFSYFNEHSFLKLLFCRCYARCGLGGVLREEDPRTTRSNFNYYVQLSHKCTPNLTNCRNPDTLSITELRIEFVEHNVTAGNVREIV
jgi:hypothetical protein